MFVGIDVAKAELVVAVHPTAERWIVANDERGVRTLVERLLGFGLANDDLSEVHLDVLGNAAVFVLSTIMCCALACIVPTRRALRIQPTEALKDEG